MRKFLFPYLLLLAFSLFAETREVVIYQTTDVHASERWPQLATLLRQEIAATGPDRALLIDCGDSVQGSPLAAMTKGISALQPYLHLPYDAWIPGNHEADYGVEGMRRFFHVMKDRILCGNLQIQGEAPPPAYRILHRNGLSIAVIGISAQYFRHWLLPQENSKLQILTAQETLKKILPQIAQEHPDIILLAIHQAWTERPDTRGVNEVHEIARFFPEIHCILGAHSHRQFPGRKIGLNTWYVQAGCHAECIGKIRIAADTATHRIVSIQSELLPVHSALPPDPEVAQAIRLLGEKEEQALQTPLGIQLKHRVEPRGRPGQNNAMSELLCRAIAEASGADIAFHGILGTAELPAIPLTLRHLFAVVPYENSIVTAEVTAAELTAIMAEQWTQRNSYRYCGPWNVHFLIGRDVHFLRCDAPPSGHDGRYRIAVNSHTAAGSGTLPILRYILEKPECRMHDTGIATRDALLQYLQRHPDLPPPVNFLHKTP